MAEILGKNTKKEIMKDILNKLHKKEISVEEAKNRFLNEIGDINSVEIAEIEQSLIEDGVPVELIQNFCNVHASIFELTLKRLAKDKTNPNHPVQIFKEENKKIQKLCNSIEKLINESIPMDKLKPELKNLLEKLKEIEIHYEKKEQLIFPYLEKKNFSGPSKVMWGKHNEIRNILKKALKEIDNVSNETFENFKRDIIKNLLEEVKSMIFKEENILFPAAIEKLDENEWKEILKGTAEIGFCLIDGPEELKFISKELNFIENFNSDNLTSTLSKDLSKDITLPTGTFTLKELKAVLNTLPVDITFIDANDEVKYFSDTKTRVFTRTKSILGRKVQNCHPPKSLDAVEKILKSFKDGSKDFYDFWLEVNNKFIYIRYFAVRDENNKYIGTLEVTQDITEIRKLKGEKRLVE